MPCLRLRGINLEVGITLMHEEGEDLEDVGEGEELGHRIEWQEPKQKLYSFRKSLTQNKRIIL